jgi:hypothetical protein
MVSVLPIGHRDVVEGERGRGAGRLTCARLELFWSWIRGGAAGAEPCSSYSLASLGEIWAVAGADLQPPLMAPKHHVETGGCCGADDRGGEALRMRGSSVHGGGEWGEDGAEGGGAGASKLWRLARKAIARSRRGRMYRGERQGEDNGYRGEG